MNLIPWQIFPHLGNNINRTAHPVSIVILRRRKLHTLSILQNSLIVCHLARLRPKPSSIITNLHPRQRFNIQIILTNPLRSSKTHLRRFSLSQIPNNRRIHAPILTIIVKPRKLSFSSLTLPLIPQLTFLIKNASIGTHIAFDIQWNILVDRILGVTISAAFRPDTRDYLFVVKFNECLLFLFCHFVAFFRWFYVRFLLIWACWAQVFLD